MSGTPDPRLVFISFKSDERDVAVADLLHKSLSKRRYKVWWQEELQCGHVWHTDIDTALNSAACVVVLWSPASMASEWVKHEASQAIARRVYAPARLAAMNIDSPFDRMQATDLIDWAGDEAHAGFQNLLKRVEELLPPKPTPLTVTSRFAKRHAFTAILLAFAVVSVGLLLQLAATADAQMTVQRESMKQMEASEKAISMLIATTDALVEPELRFSYTLGIGAQDSGHFSIENTSSGLAKIASVRASIDGKPVLTDAASLSSLGLRYGLVGQTLKVGESIGPGRSLKIYDIPAEDIKAVSQRCQRDKDRKQFISRFQLEIDYISLRGKMKTLKNDYKSTNKFDCEKVGRTKATS